MKYIYSKKSVAELDDLFPRDTILRPAPRGSNSGPGRAGSGRLQPHPQLQDLRLPSPNPGQVQRGCYLMKSSQTMS